MALDRDRAKMLLDLGFSLPASHTQRHKQIWWFEDEGSPFEGEGYCAGGRMSPSGPIAMSSSLEKQGLWLPTLSELLQWLELKQFSLCIEVKRQLSNITATSTGGELYRAQEKNLEMALFQLISLILKSGIEPGFATAARHLSCQSVQIPQCRFILKHRDSGMAWRIAEGVEQRLASMQLPLTIEAVEWKPYLSRHEPTEVIITFSPLDNAKMDDLQSLYACSWRSDGDSTVWNSIDHPEEVCINEAVDWAQIKVVCASEFTEAV